jgi:hypothetical protein
LQEDTGENFNREPSNLLDRLRRLKLYPRD